LVSSPLTVEVKVLLVLLIQHRSGDIGHISSGITLSSDIDLEVFNPEKLLEILEEFDKVLRSLLLRIGGWGTN
jgi:hypothetical protein